jgi:hypothetical protein
VTQPVVPRSRMAMLMFVTVSVVFLFGVALAILLLRMFLGTDDRAPIAIALIATALPAGSATLAFLFVSRSESGRKGFAALAVFLGSLAGTVLFLPFAGIGLLLSAGAAGGFAVLARRLLDDRPAQS